jgi:hypothetical protein
MGSARQDAKLRSGGQRDGRRANDGNRCHGASVERSRPVREARNFAQAGAAVNGKIRAT